MITIAQATEHWGWRIVELIGDIALPLAAVWVAYIGLNTWRSQIRCNAEHDVARRLMRAALKARDAIQAVRHPLMTAAELPPDKTGSSESVGPQKHDHVKFLRDVYAVRWERLSSAMSDLYVEALEAEVLWPGEIDRTVKAVRGCVATLFVAIELWLDIRSGTEQADKEEKARLRRILYSSGRGEDGDELTAQLDRAIADLRAFIEPAIKASHRG